MRRSKYILLLFMLLTVLSVPDAYACFGDKLGIGHLKGADNEFTAHLIALYIKEKTGIDSVVKEFTEYAPAEKSLKADKMDLIVMTGKKSELDNEKLSGNNEESKFFTILEDGDFKVLIRVSKKRLNDEKFFTLNREMDRIGKVIGHADFRARVSAVNSGTKFPREAAREYLKEKDLQ